MSLILRLTCIAMLAFLVACGSSPKAADHEDSSHRADDTTAQQAAEYARGMVGKPYRYGGNSPAGFDCSGLVQYSYSRAGLPVPRTTRSQRQSSVAIGSRSLREGDLVFFDQEGQKSSHVGIYWPLHSRPVKREARSCRQTGREILAEALRGRSPHLKKKQSGKQKH